MTNHDHDPLLTALAELSTEPPAGLLDRIVARWVRVSGPTGELAVAFTERGIAYLQPNSADFATDFRLRFTRPLLSADRPPAGLLPALRSGRAGGLAFDLTGISAFQQAVLVAAQSIPKGQVRPYSWIARQIGRPKAVRAVGSALGHNPVPILIPCHRVVRSDRQIGGYVFGAETKESLLRKENVNLDEMWTLAADGVYYLGSDTTGVVCFPSCHHARRITPAHRHGFRTVAQAASVGYRPCRHCQPNLAETA